MAAAATTTVATRQTKNRVWGVQADVLNGLGEALRVIGDQKIQTVSKTMIRSTGSSIAGLSGVCDELISGASPPFAKKLRTFKADVTQKIGSGNCELIGVIESDKSDASKLEYCFLLMRKTGNIVDYILVHYDHRRERNAENLGVGVTSLGLGGGFAIGAAFVVNPVGFAVLGSLAAVYTAVGLGVIKDANNCKIDEKSRKAVECAVLTSLVNCKVLTLEDGDLFVDFS